ncbi:hypothetical protein C9427_30335 [Mesorhizobium helmanticense]|uniref:Uncharacterized protein n=1 Tax=Mesorhizobium helmanticense TaxID=1776423 RepID=A0A2T4IMA7_9HYPH|nr:hypothetical protein C9427_30335 [Mesorhizobium helmanticense]
MLDVAGVDDGPCESSRPIVGTRSQAALAIFGGRTCCHNVASYHLKDFWAEQAPSEFVNARISRQGEQYLMRDLAGTVTIIASIAVAIVLALMVPKGLHDPADNPIVSADSALPSTAIQGP